MKRLLAALICVFLLAGCAGQEDGVARAMELRQAMQNGSGCSFRARVCADYKEEVYRFSMDCQADSSGNLTFTVTEPESISAITGTVDDVGGRLTFDDVMLAFPKLADNLISPVTAPWLMIKTLRGGYITSAGSDENEIHVVINDSYDEQALQLDFWLTEESVPARCEILWQGTRILSMDVENFTIL